MIIDINNDNLIRIAISWRLWPMPCVCMCCADHIHVKGARTFIVANETWGAVRALETFSQLLYRTADRRVRVRSRMSSVLRHRLVLCADTAVALRAHFNLLTAAA